VIKQFSSLFIIIFRFDFYRRLHRISVHKIGLQFTLQVNVFTNFGVELIEVWLGFG